MNRAKENDILETTLSIAEKGYPEAYQFLQNAYEESPGSFGPQTFYFLACLADGSGAALAWLRKAIQENNWWYRPEVLEDDDLAALQNDGSFLSLKAISDGRYGAALSKATAIFSWKKKRADNLFLAIHGNTQNGDVARADWEPIVGTSGLWQLETVQSAQPDGYGTYRWSYDSTSYLPVANAMEKVQNQGYQKIACGGFSAGCDMLLRAVTFSPVRCDLLILQSPWIPILQDQAEAVVRAILQKNIALRIFCGAEDADCLPMAKQLYAVTKQAGCNVTLTVQENTRHQFPAQPYHVLKQNNAPTMTVNDAEYTVIKLLGKGKGGYSYLVTDGTAQYVLKQIHHEPCDYYTFGDKLQSELRDYETLRNLGIPMPRLLAVDTPQERILKEYIAGQTVAEQLQEGRMEPDWLKQVQAMCRLLYPAGLNIDYYPTNFVPHDGTLYYIDYECNGYMEQWDFEHWGAQYWTVQTPERTEKP